MELPQQDTFTKNFIIRKKKLINTEQISHLFTENNMTEKVNKVYTEKKQTALKYD